MKKIETAYPLAVIIYVICDNARYYRSRLVNQFLETSKIQLVFLPSYSPNLNSIERLWKIMREHVTYNKYYPMFAEFKDKVHEFFSTTIPEIRHILEARINDKFEVVRHNTVQLSS